MNPIPVLVALGGLSVNPHHVASVEDAPSSVEGPSTQAIVKMVNGDSHLVNITHAEVFQLVSPTPPMPTPPPPPPAPVNIIDEFVATLAGVLRAMGYTVTAPTA